MPHGNRDGHPSYGNQWTSAIRQDRDHNRFNIDDDDRSGRTWGGLDRDRDDGPSQGEPIHASYRDREPYGGFGPGDRGPYPPGRSRRGRFS